MLRPFRLGYSWVVASPQSHLRFTKHYLHPITQLAIQGFPKALNMIRFDPDQPRVIRHVDDIPSTELARILLRVSRVNPASPPLNSGVLVILTFLRDRYEQWRDDQVNSDQELSHFCGLAGRVVARCVAAMIEFGGCLNLASVGR